MIRLASKSPRRQELLKLITDFEITALDTDESLPEGILPEEAVKVLALRKAEAVASLYPGDWVIGSDTVVALDKEILGKPKNREDGMRMLLALSGKKHIVFTGVAIAGPGGPQCFVEATEVDFYPLSREEIGAYLDTGEPYDKAGAYAIQGKGALLVKEIRGDYYNVMGLPVARLARVLKSIEIG